MHLSHPKNAHFPLQIHQTTAGELGLRESTLQLLTNSRILSKQSWYPPPMAKMYLSYTTNPIPRLSKPPHYTHSAMRTRGFASGNQKTREMHWTRQVTPQTFGRKTCSGSAASWKRHTPQAQEAPIARASLPSTCSAMSGILQKFHSFRPISLIFLNLCLISYFVRLHCANIHTPLPFFLIFTTQNIKTRNSNLLGAREDH